MNDEYKDKINDVFEKFKIVTPLAYYFKFKSIFTDNIEFYTFVFVSMVSTSDNTIYDRYAIKGFRKSEFYENRYTFTKDIRTENYQNIGKAKIPKVSVAMEYLSSKEIHLHHRFFHGWVLNDKLDDFFFRVMIVDYSDLVKNFRIKDPFDPFPAFDMHASFLLTDIQTPIGYCEPPYFDDYIEIDPITFNYRY